MSVTTMSITTKKRAGAAIAVAVLLSGLAGCAAPGIPGGEPPPAAGDVDGSAPAAFADRDALPACTPVTLGQGEEIPADALACLEEAGAEGAELALTRPTTEGDPVTEYFRVLPAGGWEIYTDMTRDAFGGGWWLAVCPDAVSMTDLGECSSTEL